MDLRTCVDAGELLEEHGNGSDDDPSEHGFRGEQRSDGHELELEGVPWCEFDEMRPLDCRAALLE